MRKITAATMAITVLGTTVMPAFADEVVDNIRYQQAIVAEQQAQTINALDTLRGDISYLEEQKNALLAKADEYDQKLITTIATINTINKQIEKKEADLKKTGEDLKKAKEDESKQYDAMKNRIQYMYEEGGNGGLATVMMETGSIADLLNKAAFTQKMYEYDRECLDAYTDAVAKVTLLQKKQREQKSALLSMKREQENVQTNLEDLKSKAMAASDDYKAQIAYCEGVAAQYEALIAEQNAQIWQLQAAEAEAVAAEQARIAAAEEAARQQAEQQAAMEAMAQQQAMQAAEEQAYGYTEEGYTEEQAYGYSEQDYSYDESGYEYTDEGVYTEDYTYTEDTGYTEDYSYDDGYYYEEPTYDYSEPTYEYTEPTYDYSEPVSTTDSSSLGSQIANYATQFVGNPYVWGGTSLTDGADCSGFVQSVFGDYGINLSRTTYTQANEGTPVSYADMQPGDVINYGYHTAIYLGDNKIVHAADEDLGIIIQDNPAYQPIVTIRRFT